MPFIQPPDFKQINDPNVTKDDIGVGYKLRVLQQVQTVKYLKSVYYSVKDTRITRPRYINNDNGVNVMELQENDKMIETKECGSIPQITDLKFKQPKYQLLFDEHEIIDGKKVQVNLPCSSESDDNSLQNNDKIINQSTDLSEREKIAL